MLRAPAGAAGVAGTAGVTGAVGRSGALGLEFRLRGGFGGAVAVAVWAYVREALTAVKAMFRATCWA